MKLTIRNFAGVEALDCELSGITLLAGGNAVGKSSAVEAVGCLVTSSPFARGVTTKGGADGLLRDGAPAGAITLLENSTWALRINYPSLAVQTNGSVPPLGSPLSVGLVRFGALSKKDRAKALAAHFRLDPTFEDFTEAVSKTGGPELSAAELSKIWQRIEEQGWDAIARSVREDGTKLKGGWERVTGESFGATKSLQWCPADLDPAESYDLSALKADRVTARAMLDKAIGAASVATADRARLTAISDTLLVRRANLKDDEDALAAVTAEIKKLGETLVTQEREQKERVALVCPHCKKSVRLSRTANSQPVLVAESVIPEADPLTLAADIAKTKGKGRDAVARQKELHASVIARRTQVMEAETAFDQLAALPPEGSEQASDGQGVETAQAEFDRLDKLVRALEARTNARDLALEIEKHTALVMILEPSGLRAECVRRSLQGVNEAMTIHCLTAGWKPVLITGEMEVLFGGRLYGLCSESERWRADLVLTAAFARAEGPAIVLVDRMDVLAPQDRIGVIKLLAKLGIASLVSCTAKERSAVPDLERLKLGRTIWMVEGRVA